MPPHQRLPERLQALTTTHQQLVSEKWPLGDILRTPPSRRGRGGVRVWGKYAVSTPSGEPTLEAERLTPEEQAALH